MPAKGASLSRKYVDWLRQGRNSIFVLLIWLVVGGVGAYFAPKLLHSTADLTPPPRSTMAAKAQERVAQIFPKWTHHTTLIVFIEADDRSGGEGQANLREDAGGHLAAFQSALNASVLAYNNNDEDSASGIPGVPFVTAVRGYFLMRDAGLPATMYEPFMSKNNRSTIVAIQLSCRMVGNPAEDFSGWLGKRVEALRPHHADWKVAVTGVPAFVRPVTKAVMSDMESMDMFVLPLAFIILGAMLRSWRLLLVPLLSICLAVALSFSLALILAKHAAVFTTVPSLMMSMTLAFTIDYDLFLLVRYRWELRQSDESGARDSPRGGTRKKGELSRGLSAVVRMLRYAGHTIVVSGLTLVVCFIGMLTFIPFEALQTLAAGCAIAILSTLGVALTLTPALLVAFESFFVKSSDECRCGSTRSRRRSAESVASTDSPGSGAAELQPLIHPSAKNSGSGAKKQSRGMRAARCVVRWPWNFFFTIAVLSVTLPVALKVRSMSMSDSVQLDMPRDLPQTKAYIRMIGDFGEGAASLCNLVMQPPPQARHAPGVGGLGAVINETFFTQVQTAIDKWGNTLPSTSADDFYGLMHVPGFQPSASLVAACMTPGSPIYGLSACKAARMEFPLLVSDDGQTTVVTFTPRAFDPVTTQGREWEAAMRAALAELKNETGIETYLIGPAIGMNDVMDLVFNYFPTMIAATGGICLVLLGVAFRSVVIPLASVVSVGVTIAFVYGGAVSVFQDGVLDGLGIAGLQGEGMLSWLPPICSLIILLGLTLDFTVFLLVHVLEARREGLRTREAIATALDRTLWIITAAGIIMAVAFSGLLLSQIPVLNLFGFYLCAAVLVDTFVVRAVLLPALLSQFGEAVWWPFPKWAAGPAPSVAERITDGDGV